SARESAQLNAGVTGSPRWSKPSRVCIAVLNDSATTGLLCSAAQPTQSTSAAIAASRTRTASCTASPDSSVRNGYDLSVQCSTRPSLVAATTFVDVVPRSITKTTGSWRMDPTYRGRCDPFRRHGTRHGKRTTTTPPRPENLAVKRNSAGGLLSERDQPAGERERTTRRSTIDKGAFPPLGRKAPRARSDQPTIVSAIW